MRPMCAARQHALLLALSLFTWTFSGVSRAGTPHLVLDINSQNVTVGSFPTDYFNAGAWSFVDADDGTHGFEPWITDGTSAGTFMWADTNPGMGGVLRQQPIVAADRAFLIYFASNVGTSIWVTDGTRQGSRAVVTIPVATGGVNPGPIGALGRNLLFTILNQATGNRDLWISDGTEAGTRRVTAASGDSFSVYSQIIENGRVYFLNGSGPAGMEPWVSDGTAAGTLRLAQIPNSVRETIFTPTLARAGNYIVFPELTSDSGRELWRIDLTSNAVSQVIDIAPGAASAITDMWFGELGNVVVFAASAAGNGTSTLWRSDGTAAGTYSIGNVTPAVVFLPEFFGSSDTGALLFYSTTATGQELWATDGSAAGTQRLVTADKGAVGLYQIGKHYYFTSAGGQVWTTTGTITSTQPLNGVPASPSQGTIQLAGSDTTVFVRDPTDAMSGRIFRFDVATGNVTQIATYSFTTQSAYVTGVFGFGQGRLYFDNEDSVHGRELWSSDGTAAGTAILKNIAPETQTQSSSPADFVSLNGRLFFTADDGITGREVWYSDGTAAGTQELIDANPGPASSSPSDLFVANGSLYFFAKDQTGTSKLWRSDGTTAGTVALVQAAPWPAYAQLEGCDGRGVALGSSVLFPAAQGPAIQLWKTDGTPGGTTAISNIPAPGFEPCNLVAQGNRVYFQGNGPGGPELWSSDGSSAGTMQVANIVPDPFGSSPRNLIALGNAVFFLANAPAQSPQLWTSDGTAAGTHVATTFGTGAPQSVASLNSTQLLVSVTGGNSGTIELWITDGTTTGTQRLATSLSNASITSIFTNRGRGYFSSTATGTAQPWVTDGTVTGTKLLLTINPNMGSNPMFFTDFDGITVFQASSSSTTPQQIWRTDGTSAGTRMVANVPLGALSMAAGPNLFFVGNDGSTGAELWALTNEAPLAAPHSVDSVLAGSSATIDLLANGSDPDGALDPSSVKIVTQPAHGTVSVGTNGVATYSAASGYSGPDAFTYTIADDQGLDSAPAQVTITVAAPAPTGGSGGSSGTGSGGDSAAKGGGGSLGLLEISALALLMLLARFVPSKTLRNARGSPAREQRAREISSPRSKR
jgi:ELWxxDGT repeat protein